MSTVNINGTQYDFNRCTKEQLVAYVYDLTAQHNSGVRLAGSSQHASGNVVLGAARIPPPERKEDVARELSEAVARVYLDNTSCGNTMEIIVLAERYRRAV